MTDRKVVAKFTLKTPVEYTDRAFQVASHWRTYEFQPGEYAVIRSFGPTIPHRITYSVKFNAVIKGSYFGGSDMNRDVGEECGHIVWHDTWEMAKVFSGERELFYGQGDYESQLEITDPELKVGVVVSADQQLQQARDYKARLMNKRLVYMSRLSALLADRAPQYKVDNTRRALQSVDQMMSAIVPDKTYQDLYGITMDHQKAE